MAEAVTRQNPWHHLLEWTGVLSLPLLIGWLLWRTGTALWVSGHSAWLPMACIGALFAADFAAGIVHWLGDTYLDEQFPFLGPAFIEPFRHHHVDPQDVANHDLVNNLGNPSLLLSLVLSAVALIEPTVISLAARYSIFTSAAWALWMIATNVFHRWAHTDPTQLAAIVRWLQHRHLILNPSHHELHHAAPYKVAYCITTGWCNPLLDRIGFFRASERVLAVLGLRPST